ncbi:MAG: TIGR01244 family phosphatase [Rhizobiales bacterium]|nr:TIGR01244 family phosphatase [Hyphomicrobiales bacterium]
MKTVRINERLSVAGQMSTADVAKAVTAGFRTIINNRPDGEEPGQPPSDVIEAAAQRDGLSYVRLPVRGPDITEDKVRAFQAAIANSDGPVLAHCRSGTRSLTLFVIGEALDGRMRVQEIEAFGARNGFDLRGAVAWLRAHGQ